MPRQMCGPAATAPTQSEKVAICKVCHTQWQIQSMDDEPADAQGCKFCDAPANAIIIQHERLDYSMGSSRSRRDTRS